MSDINKEEEREFKFNLGNAYEFDRFPMKRLAEYLQEIIGLVGSDQHAYFIRLEPGSAVAVVRTEADEVPALENGLRAVVRGDASPDRVAHFRQLTSMIAADAAEHAAPVPQQAEVIQFPVRNIIKRTAIKYGKVVQWDTVKGPVKALGGDGDNLWIHVKNRETGRQLRCRANRETARKVATYLFEEVDLRFEGVATWSRSDQGRWDMELFEIKDFRPLKGTAIDIEVAQFQSIESTWSDPLRALDVIRLRG